MATFEEPSEEEIEFDDINELEQKQKEPEAVEEPTVEDKPEVVVPDKYQGKSVEDIVKMHQEAEKLIGKQAQEVGEVRRLADELLKRELSQKQAVETPKEEIDLASRLYEDPASVINETVNKHPAIAEARHQAQSMKQQQVLEKLKNNFPDYEQTLTDNNFVEWVKDSPIRIRLLSEANSNYDYDSAAEIFTTWNVLKPKEQITDLNVAEESKKERDKTLKAATVNTGSSAPVSRKTYRRSDLINLRLRDPARYEAMSDEIMAAYAEGRVK
jgi:hypothetical protein